MDDTGRFLPCWFVYFTEVLQHYWIPQSDECKNRLLQEIACRNLVMRAWGHLGGEMMRRVKTHLDINSLSILGNFSTEQVVFPVFQSLIFVRNFPPSPRRLRNLRGEKPRIFSLLLWAGGG